MWTQADPWLVFFCSTRALATRPHPAVLERDRNLQLFCYVNAVRHPFCIGISQQNIPVAIRIISALPTRINLSSFFAIRINQCGRLDGRSRQTPPGAKASNLISACDANKLNAPTFWLKWMLFVATSVQFTCVSICFMGNYCGWKFQRVFSGRSIRGFNLRFYFGDVHVKEAFTHLFRQWWYWRIIAITVG